jgi:transaldolase/glucose-6-phosphate isomerase
MDTVTNTGEQTGANPVKQLLAHGQSPWLDFIRRSFIADGSLKKLVDADGLGGVTSNPSIFEKAMGSGADYDPQFKALAAGGTHDANELYETMAVDDIRHAADVLRPVYDRTRGLDGFVSLEVSPYLALRTEETIAEARRLWAWVDRPNLMVKVPGTAQGAPSVRILIEDGININVTLLFALSAYQAVADAYLTGLEARVAKGLEVSRISSVASFFVSRIDAAIDKTIDDRVASGDPEAAALMTLRGRVAIANAKQAYAWYQEMIESERWKKLQAAGANPQRLLWASTGTKDKAYSDVLYVESLIGRDTVNTMPPATMDAFRDHGKALHTLGEGIEEARHVLAQAERLGLDLGAVTAHLVEDGVTLFADAFDHLLGAVAQKRSTLMGSALSALKWTLPADLDRAVGDGLETWRRCGNVRKLWARDAGLWTGGDEAQWLAWLGIVDERIKNIQELLDFQLDVKQAGFAHVLLLGMGGSSLGPEVLGRTFGHRAGWPDLHVLDSTDPQQIKSFENKVDLARTLVIVSSKSGGTLEPNILKAYFFDRMSQAVGAGNAASHFVAVTDPGSHMQKVAEDDGFRHIFYGDAGIGGRYSVLSNFGLVPAAAIGIDIAEFLASAARMVKSCSPGTPPAQNPGVQLGVILGQACLQKHDKVTIAASPGIADLGAWLEQLIAESTGKIGRGLIPIDGEKLGTSDVYGRDRVFAYLRLQDAPDAAQDEAIAALEKAGQPVIHAGLNGHMEIAQQFFLWEFAVAVAGALIGINAFNQPDVEASKIKTKELTDAYSKTGSLPAETPFAEFEGVRLFADGPNEAALKGGSLADVLRVHFDRLHPGDYVGLLAYIERNPAHIATLDEMRLLVRDATHVAVAAEFGPRFLHSTGQAYKGGPNSGVFLQITADEAADLNVPGERYSFSTVKAAQARGDFGVLAERGRRALRVHLVGDVDAGLDRLLAAAAEALK